VLSYFPVTMKLVYLEMYSITYLIKSYKKSSKNNKTVDNNNILLYNRKKDTASRGVILVHDLTNILCAI